MADFQHILRVLNTNVDGREKVVIALTAIRGIGRRISTLICKKADIDTDKRAGELTADEISKVRALRCTYTSPLQLSRHPPSLSSLLFIVRHSGGFFPFFSPLRN